MLRRQLPAGFSWGCACCESSPARFVRVVLEGRGEARAASVVFGGFLCAACRPDAAIPERCECGAVEADAVGVFVYRFQWSRQSAADCKWADPVAQFVRVRAVCAACDRAFV